MKLLSNKLISGLLIVSGLTTSLMIQAGQLDIHPKPLEVSGNADVLPNVMFILDDSGSMSWTFMPDRANNFLNDYGYQSSQCNGVYYDPNITYTPPYNPNLAGGFYPNMSFTSARDDGFDTGSNNTNLNTQFNANRYVPNNLNNAYGGATYNATGAIYYEYTGNVTDKNYNNTNSAFYQECNTPVGNNTNVFVQRRLSTTVNAVLDFSGLWTGNGSTVSAVRICPTCTNLLSANASGTNANAVAESVRVRINNNSGATGISAQRNGAVVTLTSSNAVAQNFINQSLVVSATGWYWLNAWVQGGVRTFAFSDNDPEKLTNFANWYSYYRTRMLTMKTSVGLAFKDIDNRYRVGFMTINNKTGNNYLPIDKFDLGTGQHKNTWFQILNNINPQALGTPLRSSLSTTGRIFAGKVGADPMQYACQANYSLITTDGYWNSDTASAIKDVNNNNIGNLDGNGTPRPQFEGGIATSGTLADIAKYYYDTDIRDGGNTNNFGNCTGALGQNVCGAVGDHLQQNMITLSLGLGADGTLKFEENYKDQTTGDFADIKTGSKNWPVPANDSPNNIDDLWHAAVNGGGTYFSAKNPTTLKDSLIKALADIQVTRGSGSAAAASNLAPVAEDNFAFIASYRIANGPVSLPATGNLEARRVDVNTFEISKNADWCVENIPLTECVAPSVGESVFVNGQNQWYCVTPNSDATSCDSQSGTIGVGTRANGCYVPQANKCTGRLQAQVQANTRNIYISNGTSALPLNVSNVNVATLDAGIRNLTQWPNIRTKTPSGGATTLENETPTARVGYLIDYLKGQTTYENQSSNTNPERKLFRNREFTLGDITESEPKFIGQTNLNYSDTGFEAFATQLASRPRAVVVGANDGMLHAFNATNGDEMWAFIPSMVADKLPLLADEAYGTSIEHANYVNGSPKEMSICTSNPCTGNWKSILVGGLNNGGRGYYAIDTTNPASPSLLWEISANSPGFQNLGLTYSDPIATKLSNGQWVIMFASGYNNGTYQNDPNDNILNSPQGDGRGHLYIVDPISGALIKDIPTSAGTPTSPSGLAKITARVIDPFVNNTVKHVYAGDLEGNIWRFDPNLGTVVKVATNGGQPITTKLEIGLVKGKPVLFVGTGKYLELADLTNNDVQSLYAFGVDENNTNPATINLRGGTLVAQTLVDNGNTRSVSNPQTVDFSTNAGWMIDFLPGGERVDVDPILAQGVLMVPTRVPFSSSCAGGGFGWMNFFDYKTGSSAFPGSDLVSEKSNLPIQGMNLFYDKDGNLTPVAVDSEGNTKTFETLPNNGGNVRDTLFYHYNDGTYGRRSIWRNLIKE